MQPIVNDTEDLFYGVIEDGTLIMSTNWKAPKWRIFSVDLKNPGRDAWERNRSDERRFV